MMTVTNISWFCSECGHFNNSSWGKCKNCGNEDMFRFPRNVWTCPNCKTTNLVSVHQCGSCGAMAEWYRIRHNIEPAPVTRFSMALKKQTKA